MGNTTSNMDLYGKTDLLSDFGDGLESVHDMVVPPQVQVLQRNMNAGTAGNYTYDRELVEQLKVDRPLPRDADPPTIAQEIARSKMVVVLTGAGVSAASGLPTFRDPTDGIWTRFDPRCATIDGFNQNPTKTWQLYSEIEVEDQGMRVNAAHAALAELEQLGFVNLLVTQNVDMLHELAGNTKVLHYHGQVGRAHCTACKTESAITGTLLRTMELPPRCSECQNVLRPDAKLFGEPIDPAVRVASLEAVRACDLLLVVGTSAHVAPASDLPITAVNAGARVIEINLENTQLTYNRISDAYILGRAEELLPVIVSEVRKIVEASATYQSVQSNLMIIQDGVDAIGAQIVDSLNA